ncbi:family 16 glycosylhydrolase [Saccharicrinis sp. FJH62]|uniref:glycoside hydrolase family 16 protein n=1 Tax=Saccharicrinis sp. FJH62 TaxID=3344657 RepID=UPI0035D46B2A
MKDTLPVKPNLRFLIPVILFLFIFIIKSKAQVNGSMQPKSQVPEMIFDMHLVWHDEFNEDGRPNPENWTYEYGFVRNNELQWYQPENAICKDGVLVITGKKDSIPNTHFNANSRDWRKQRPYAEFSSSCLISRGLQEWSSYGYFEIRAKIDTAKGSWPAIWTLGKEKHWPECGEIDIMEFYRVNDQPTILANAAWGGENGRGVSWDSQRLPLSHFTDNDPDWVNKFHVWGMKWDQEVIKLYLDNELLNEIPLDKTRNNDGFNPFREGNTHYILLNLAIGSNGGEPNADLFPITFKVDYVRVYQ